MSDSFMTLDPSYFGLYKGIINKVVSTKTPKSNIKFSLPLGMGGFCVQDQNADVRIEQVLTTFMHHNEIFFDNLTLKFKEGSYQNLDFLKISQHCNQF